jgi:hypothetical protein
MRKKKIKDTYKLLIPSEEVVQQRKELAELKNQYMSVEKSMSTDIDSVAVNVSSVEELATKLQSLPLETLEESCNFDNGKWRSFYKLILEREKIIKKNRKREDELRKLKDKIQITEIDVVLSNINSLIKKLEI